MSFIPTLLANVIGHSTHWCIIDDLGGIMGPYPVHIVNMKASEIEFLAKMTALEMPTAITL